MVDCSHIALKFVQLQIARRKSHGRKALNPAYIITYAERSGLSISDIENFFYKFTFNEDKNVEEKDYEIALRVVKAQSKDYEKKFLDEAYFSSLASALNVEIGLLKDFFNAIFE